MVALTLEIALVSTLVFHAGSEFIATRSISQILKPHSFQWRPRAKQGHVISERGNVKPQWGVGKAGHRRGI